MMKLSNNKRYYGSAVILTFPCKSKNLTNPFSWTLFAIHMFNVDLMDMWDKYYSFYGPI